MLGYKNKTKDEHLRILENPVIRIGFLCPFSGCGSTFLASGLAMYLGNLWKKDLLHKFQICPNTYVDMSLSEDGESFVKKYEMDGKWENGTADLEYEFGTLGGVSEIGTTFKQIKEKNIYCGVRWIVPKENYKTFSEEIRRKALDFKLGEVVVYDFGCSLERESEIKAMDIIIAVIDPLESKLSANKVNLELIKNLRAIGRYTCFVVNKFNGGVSKRSIRRVLEGGDIKYFPLIEGEKVYLYDSEGRFLWEEKGVFKLIEELYSSIDLINLSYG